MSDDFTPNRPDLVRRNAAYADSFTDGTLDVAPRRRLAIVACMDARLDVLGLLGLDNGDAHIIRNGGGAVTDDAIRSLCLSQRALGTREIVLIHHTDCGLSKVGEDEFKQGLEDELGIRPPWSVESFADAHADVRQSIERIRRSPFIAHTDAISGFVYDVATGLLDPVA